MAAGIEMAAATERTTPFALAAWRRAWPAALFAVALAVAAVAVEAPAGRVPEVAVEIEATSPVTWRIAVDGQPQAGDSLQGTRWRGTAPSPTARLLIETEPLAAGAGVALRIVVRAGARSGETLVWGGHADVHLAELLHGDAP
jgi:hypothetical protein